MTEAEAVDVLIDAGCTLMRVPIDHAWRAAIGANLQVTMRLAELVDSFALPDEADPAPVFRV